MFSSSKIADHSAVLALMLSGANSDDVVHVAGVHTGITKIVNRAASRYKPVP